MVIVVSVLLLLIANGAPIVARQLLGSRWDAPLDGGRVLADGRRLLGPTKTLRGVAAAVLATAGTAALLGYPPGLGATFGALAMIGDMFSSFVKRRVGVAPSDMALGLDQIPEALLPVLLLRVPLGLSWPGVGYAVGGFFLLGLVLSRLLFHLRLRKRPY